MNTSIIPLLPDALVQRIASLQADGSGLFPAGIFPAYRLNPNWRYHRPDTNLFYTAITVFTLQQLRPRLSPNSQVLVDLITARGTAAYALFQNKDGLKTYNFYPTQPSRHFPHGYVMRHFRHFKLPDDIDDTAMVYLTTQPTPTDLQWLHQKVAQHANGTQYRVRNTFPAYRHLRAYSTWFGKTMPIEFDACALCNLLYCLYQYNLPLNQHDHDSLTFLRTLVESDRYRIDPFRCAHNYARTTLIIYHLARFIATFDPVELQSVRQKLIDDAHSELTQATNRLDKLILITALLRLGESAETLPAIDLTAIEQEFPRFHFFIAGMLSAYQWPGLYRWAAQPFWHIRWRCDAYHWALVLEYIVEINPG